MAPTRRGLVVVVRQLLSGFATAGQPLFPPFGADTILAPTLDWRLHAGAAAKVDAEVGYVTGGLRWIASYNLVAPEHGDLVDVVGWITIENTCGKTFRDATIKLMAGDVNKVTPSEGPRGPSPAGPGVPAGVSFAPRPQVTEKAFDEFHLYSLPTARATSSGRRVAVSRSPTRPTLRAGRRCCIARANIPDSASKVRRRRSLRVGCRGPLAARSLGASIEQAPLVAA